MQEARDEDVLDEHEENEEGYPVAQRARDPPEQTVLAPRRDDVGGRAVEFGRVSHLDHACRRDLLGGRTSPAPCQLGGEFALQEGTLDVAPGSPFKRRGWS